MILAIDPGMKNLAWCLISDNGKIKDYNVLTEIYPRNLDNAGLNEGLKIVKKEINYINKIIDKNTILVYERFVPRGRFNTANLTEVTNIIIGQFLINLKVKERHPLLASTWKNRRCNYYYELKGMAKKDQEKIYYCNKTIPPHTVDSYTMGLYHLEYIKKSLSIETVMKNLKGLQRGKYGWKYTKGAWKYIKTDVS